MKLQEFTYKKLDTCPICNVSLQFIFDGFVCPNCTKINVSFRRLNDELILNSIIISLSPPIYLMIAYISDKYELVLYSIDNEENVNIIKSNSSLIFDDIFIEANKIINKYINII